MNSTITDMQISSKAEVTFKANHTSFCLNQFEYHGHATSEDANKGENKALDKQVTFNPTVTLIYAKG